MASAKTPHPPAAGEKRRAIPQQVDWPHARPQKSTGLNFFWIKKIGAGFVALGERAR